MLRAAAAGVCCHCCHGPGWESCPAADWKGYGGWIARAQDSKLAANLAFASKYQSCGFSGGWGIR